MSKMKFRKLHTQFWSDPKITEEFTPEDKLFYLYLMTNEHTTQIGVYQITKKHIAFEIGYSIETVKSLMNRFEEYHKLIKYNNDTRELAIKNWGKYNFNRGGKPVEDCVKSELKQVKDLTLLDYVSESIESSLFKGLYDNYVSQNTIRPTNRDTIRGQEEEEEEEEEIKPSRPNFSSLDMENANLLYSLILETNPKAKKPNLEKWANTFRLIRERDGHEDKTVKHLLNWCQADSFWKLNILSADTFRKQWDKLYVKAKAEFEQGKKVNQKSNAFAALEGKYNNESQSSVSAIKENQFILPE